MKYRIVTGWGYITERVVFESDSYAETASRFRRYYKEWEKEWEADTAIYTSSQERPWMLINDSGVYVSCD